MSETIEQKRPEELEMLFCNTSSGTICGKEGRADNLIKPNCPARLRKCLARKNSFCLHNLFIDEGNSLFCPGKHRTPLAGKFFFFTERVHLSCSLSLSAIRYKSDNASQRKKIESAYPHPRRLKENRRKITESFFLFFNLCTLVARRKKRSINIREEACCNVQ